MSTKTVLSDKEALWLLEPRLLKELLQKVDSLNGVVFSFESRVILLHLKACLNIN